MEGKMKKVLLMWISTLVLTFAMSICVFAGTPTNLAQTGTSTSKIAIAWQDAAGTSDTYYGIQVATDANFTNIVSKSYDYVKGQNVASVSGLSSGASYYVRVGYGTKYNNCFTNFSQAIICATVPIAPASSSVGVIDADDTSVTLSWPASAGATGYILAYAKDPQTLYYATTNSYKLPWRAELSDYVYIWPYRENGLKQKCMDTYEYAYKIGFSALTTKVSTKNFGLSYFIKNKVTTDCIYFGDGYQAQAAPVKGKGTVSGETTYKTVDLKMKYNTMYKYRVRAYVNLANGQKKYGNWSDYRYVLIPDSKKVKYQRTYGAAINLKLPKMSGASKAVVYVSTNRDTGYKKTATISGIDKKAKTYTIRKIGKKALKRGKSYYVKVQYYKKNVKSSECSDIISLTSSVYISK